MSREQELGLGEASIDATNERLAGMDFSFNFSAPAKASEPKKEEEARSAKAPASSSGGGFGNFSFGGSVPSEPAKAAVTRDGKRTSVYNPPKGSREEELGLAGASVEETNKRLDNMDFSFNFNAAPKEEPKPAAAAARAKAAPKKEEPKQASSSSSSSGGGFGNFSFGGSVPSEPTKAAVTRDGKRTSVYNPPKGSREEELGLAGASVEETNKRLDNMDFSFNFNAAPKPAAAAPKPAAAAANTSSAGGGGGSSAGTREEELGMGKASVEDTNARLETMSFSFGPEREAAEKKAKEEEEARLKKIADEVAAAAAKKKEDEEAEAAAVAFAKEQAENNPTFIYENVTPEWVSKVAEAQAVLGKGLPEDHPDRIAASGLAMQEAGRIDGMIAAMEWDPDEGDPKPAPPKETPWAPGAVRAAQKVAAAAAASSPEPPVTGEQAAVGAAASAAISEPKSEEEEEPEEEKPPVNYGEIYETVTLQWSKRLAEAQETLTKGLSDDNPVVIAARLIVLAESDRITGMIAAMDAEDEGRVPDPPKWTPWAPESAPGYQGTPPDVAEMAAAAKSTSSAPASQPAPEAEAAPAEETFDDFGDFEDNDEASAAFDNTDGFNDAGATSGGGAATTSAVTSAPVDEGEEVKEDGDGGDETNPWASSGGDDDAGDGGIGFDCNPAEPSTDGNNPWGGDMDEEENNEGYNLIGDAGEVDDVDDGEAAAAAEAEAAAKEKAALEEAAALKALREAEILDDAGGVSEVETFLMELSKDVHKRVWPVLNEEEIRDMASLGDMSKADLKGMGIKMGDASKITRAAANWGC